MKRGVKIIGTDSEAIDRAEDRDQFEKVMEKLGIPQPKGRAVTNVEDGVRAAQDIGYPVLVRPSFVLGGRAMQIVANENSLRRYLGNAVAIDADRPVLVDKYISGKDSRSMRSATERMFSCPESWSTSSAPAYIPEIR